jgi:hypothetical protein
MRRHAVDYASNQYDRSADASLAGLSDGAGSMVNVRVNGDVVSIPAERAKALMLAELKKEMRQQMKERRERREPLGAFRWGYPLRDIESTEGTYSTDLREGSATARPTVSPSRMPTGHPRWARMDPDGPVAGSSSPSPTSLPTGIPQHHDVRDPFGLSLSTWASPAPAQSWTPTAAPPHLMRAMRRERSVNAGKAFRVWGLYAPADVSPSERVRLGLAPLKVRACMRACVHACVRASVRARGGDCVCVRAGCRLGAASACEPARQIDARDRNG